MSALFCMPAMLFMFILKTPRAPPVLHAILKVAYEMDGDTAAVVNR